MRTVFITITHGKHIIGRNPPRYGETWWLNDEVLQALTYYWRKSKTIVL